VRGAAGPRPLKWQGGGRQTAPAPAPPRAAPLGPPAPWRTACLPPHRPPGARGPPGAPQKAPPSPLPPQLQQLGSSGLRVSSVALGTMTFGEQTPEDEAHRMLSFATEAGINFIDTAEARLALWGFARR
jgi:hypothetical protein